MRTLLLVLMLMLTLAACGTKNDAVEQPVADGAPQQAAEPVAKTDGEPVSTHTIKETIPDGPVGTVQLTNGDKMQIAGLEKLGGDYWIYVSGKLNGRSSTVVSLTRFRDLMHWESIVFKDTHTFTITNQKGKEWSFENANLYLGSDKPDTYSFYTMDSNYDKVLFEVKKSDVANISFGTK